ncbi:MAG: phosphatase PAP2 family protein, partial [Elusimicrobiota bacterium]
AYSRVYCGVHFPFDVAAGTVLGLLLGAIVGAAWLRWTLAGRKSKA